jgi:hypothetical protein
MTALSGDNSAMIVSVKASSMDFEVFNEAMGAGRDGFRGLLQPWAGRL